MFAATDLYARTESGTVIRVGQGDPLPDEVTEAEVKRLKAGGAATAEQPVPDPVDPPAGETDPVDPPVPDAVDPVVPEAVGKTPPAGGRGKPKE